ncbi:MAG TPA: hypothetical protein VIH59_32630 [Candidatus Tectomicrobia bacterium]|jgi:hypothetical protein
MAPALQSVTLTFSLSHLPALSTRLTTYLLQKSYDFLQTSHAAGHTDFEIFAQQQPLVHLTLQAVEEGSPTAGILAPTLPPTLAAEALELVHHLLGTPPARADTNNAAGTNA